VPIPQATLGSAPAFQQAMTYTNSEMPGRYETGGRMRRLASWPSAAAHRSTPMEPSICPASSTKQLFEYRQIAMLTIGASQSGLIKPCKQAIGVIETDQPADHEAGILADQPNYVAISNQIRDGRRRSLKEN